MGGSHRECCTDYYTGTIRPPDLQLGFGCSGCYWFSGFTNLINGRFVDNIQDIFSHFTLDNANGMHWNEMNNGQRILSATNTGNVVWDEAAVTSATGLLSNGTDLASRARLYAPSPVESGSSIAHFDTVANPDLLIEPFINPGLGSDLDLTDEQLLDMGWVLTIADTDGDSVKDSDDNCTDVANPDREDADGDGHGNICDGDLDNSCLTSTANLAIMGDVFFSADPVADLDSSGSVSTADLGIMGQLFFLPPGPSAPGKLCN